MANTSETCKSILDAALEAQLQAGCPGVILEINSPDQGFSFSAARGHFSTTKNIATKNYWLSV